MTVWIQAIATSLLGGGLVAGIGQILAARNEAKRIRSAESDTRSRQPLLAMDAAERSVAIMERALIKADEDIKELEATIRRLQSELETMREKYAELLSTLYNLQHRRIGDTDNV